MDDHEGKSDVISIMKKTRRLVNREVYLPEEILIRVLSSLPAKSLLRFKCVSKYWLGLIVSPHFINSHLRSATSKILFTCPTDPDMTLVSMDHNARDNNKTTQNYQVLLSPKLKMVGSCNGLVCLSDKETYVVLLNPATNKSIEIPFGIVEWIPVDYPFNLFDIGFGYDPLTDTYKFVRLDLSHSSSDHTGSCRAHVCTVGTKEWREIKTPFRLCHCYDMTYINGALHWFRLTDDSTWGQDATLEVDFIISLEIGSEEFGRVPLNLKTVGGSMSMGVLHECLCVYYYYDDDKGSVDIWLMKNYGVQESWTKLYKFCFKVEAPAYLVPLAVQEDGGMLLRVHDRESPMCGGLYTYDPRTDSVKEFVHSIAGWIRAVSYVESLVSVPICTSGEEATRDTKHDQDQTLTITPLKQMHLSLFL